MELGEPPVKVSGGSFGGVCEVEKVCRENFPRRFLSVLGRRGLRDTHGTHAAACHEGSVLQAACEWCVIPTLQWLQCTFLFCHLEVLLCTFQCPIRGQCSERLCRMERLWMFPTGCPWA